jgi:hypothetical protein
VKYEKYVKGRYLIWLATIRILWNVRNNIVFIGEVANVSTIVNQIILISGFWFIGD